MSNQQTESQTPSPKKPRIQDRTDDAQTHDNNPPSTDVIPSQEAEEDVVMTDETFPEINAMNDDQLLSNYRINQSKLVKVEHHIKFLEQSIAETKIPQGLQWNKDYQVIDETEDFKVQIRKIQMLAEIDIVNTILSHYKNIFQQLCRKSDAFRKTMDERNPSNPTISDKVKEIDKPIKTMKEKLTQKRTNKLNKLDTHIKRSNNYITKTKPPRQQLNSRDRNTNRRPTNQPPIYNQPPRQPRPPTQTYQQLGQIHHRREEQPTYATVTNPNRQKQVRFDLPRPRTEDHNTLLDENTIKDLITRTVQNMITQMSPYYHQQNFPMRNWNY